MPARFLPWFDDQAEPASQPCGRQGVPAEQGDLMSDPKSARDVMAAVPQMKKIDLATLRRAAGR